MLAPVRLLPALCVPFSLSRRAVFLRVVAVVVPAILFLLAISDNATFLIAATGFISTAEEVKDTHQSPLSL